MLSLLLCVACVIDDPTLELNLLKVGDPAPTIVADDWINLGDREVPSLESLRGEVVLLEFWGTWCDPCVKAMPHIQELHERYARHGVVVLGISNEPLEDLRPFLERHDYSMIVGADPALQTVTPYGVDRWPTTYLVDRDGKVAWKGNPYGVEGALDRLIGLPSKPGVMLDTFLEADAEESARREALELLALRAPNLFDLEGWSAERSRRPAPVDEFGEPIVHPTLDDSERFQLVEGSDSRAFDLAEWARDLLRERYPLSADELVRLLSENRYGDAVEALSLRSFTPDALEVVRGDDDFIAYCQTRAGVHREWVRKGLLAQHWILGRDLNELPERHGKAFGELGITAMRFADPIPVTEEGKVDREAWKSIERRVVGVSFKGSMVSEDDATAFVELNLSREIVMESVVHETEITPDLLHKRRIEENEKVLNSLRSEYGSPEPSDRGQ